MKPLMMFLFCLCNFIGYSQYLVKNLNTGPKGSNPRRFTFNYLNPNYYTYFIADSHNNSNESSAIWYSVNGGTPNKISGTGGATELAVLGTTLYFITKFSLNKLGSPIGSVESIEDVVPQSGFDYDTHDLTVSGNKLYFLSNNSLWVSGGTEPSTVEISSSVINPQKLTAIQNTQSNSVVLSAENSSGDREFVVCNGSTVVRHNINPSSDSNPTNFADVFGIGVLFSANDGSYGNELFKYNGTNAPTLVKNINPSGGSDPKPYDYKGLNGICYLVAMTANEGRELWKTDGTTAGTVLVEDINPGTASSDPEIMISRGTRLFFAATTSVFGRELWISEGTADNTNLYRNFAPDSFFNGIFYPSSSNPTFLTNSDFSVNKFFIYTQPSLFSSKNLYQIVSASDSLSVSFVKTLEGTPQGQKSGINSFANDVILFSGYDSENGQELWKSDGTENGTTLLSNIYSEPIGSFPNMNGAVSLGSNLIFSANDHINGWELFKSDGTTANTVLLKDCFSGEYSSSPTNLTKIGNYVYFAARGGTFPDGEYGYELWRTDGTAAGTAFIKDVNNSHWGSDPHNFKDYNNEAYFVATVGLSYQIYKTNGVVGNTSYVVSVADDDYEILSNALVFKKFSAATNKMEIWIKNLTSGTETKVFTPANTGSSNVSILYDANSYIIFSADSKFYIYSGAVISEILNTDIGGAFTLVGGWTYFVATFGNEKRLYKTNGTPAGTLVVKTFSNPLTVLHGLTNVNGTLYFAVNLPGGTNYAGDQIINGYIYKSDGTEAGTVVVRTYAEAAKKLRILGGSLTAGVGNELFYVLEQEMLYDPNYSMQDNTPKHTLIVDNLTTNPDATKIILNVGNSNYSYGPPNLISKTVLSNNKLYFALNDQKESKGGFGNELWAYDRNCPANISITTPTPPDMGRTLRSFNTITSNAKIFPNETIDYATPPYDKERFPVNFTATTSITLLPGFEASKNKVFKAQIGGCN